MTRTLEAYGPSGDNTQSLIDSSKMQGVADSLNTFGNTLINHIGDSAAVMTSARNNSQNYKYPEFKDLWHYAQLIKAGTTKVDLQNAATAVQNAINAATVTERHGSQRANSHGMSIYLPDPGIYSTNYANLALSRTTAWPQWVQNQPH